MDKVECVVIGAGVVGLAAARALARSGREVLVLEGAGGIGTGASSRNSEVVHAGIYYPAGSLKARFCVQGKHMLYAYCAERGIPHSRLGKLIVAAEPAEVPVLDSIRQKGRRQRRGRPGAPDRSRCPPPGTRPARRRRPAVPQHRHRGQPRPDARLPGRPGARGRRSRRPRPCPVRQGPARRLRAACRRRRADGAGVRGPGQRRRPARPGRGPAHRRRPARHHPAGAPVQGQLLLPARPRARSAA